VKWRWWRKTVVPPGLVAPATAGGSRRDTPPKSWKDTFDRYHERCVSGAPEFWRGIGSVVIPFAVVALFVLLLVLLLLQHPSLPLRALLPWLSVYSGLGACGLGAFTIAKRSVLRRRRRRARKRPPTDSDPGEVKASDPDEG
jgi:hypothetical protein